MTRAALAALLLVAGIAHADGSADADRAGAAFRDGVTRADIDALERLGSARPLTLWSDDAWAEAAKLAERGNDFARARRDLEQVIAIGTDPLLVRRAENDLARITAAAGPSGEWSSVIAETERLLPALRGDTDPRAALARLEAIARDNPGYPGATALMMSIGAGWEREGETDRALGWLREAQRNARTSPDRVHASAEIVRLLTAASRVSAAEAELQALTPYATPELVASLRAKLERAELRRDIRWVMWGLLAIIAVLAVVTLRRVSGSWRAAGRRLVRPPAEALFLVPIAIVLILVASTGNPLVAAAVRAIAIAGIAASWMSGAILSGARVTLRRAIVHAVIALVAVGAATYVAVDRGHLVDLLIETWRLGPSPR